MIKLLTTALTVIIFLAGCNQSSEQSYQSKDDSKPSSEAKSKAIYSAVMNGVIVGKMEVETRQNTISVDYSYRDNGRGPTLHEEIELDPEGFPIDWQITGSTTFGSTVNESFSSREDVASWSDATGSNSVTVTQPSLYVTQFGSPYAAFIFANALLNEEYQRLPAIPAGELSLKKMEMLSINDSSSEYKQKLTSYALSGIGLNPVYFILDEDRSLVAYITPRFIVVREGLESYDLDFRAMAEKYSAKRYEEIQAEVAHHYQSPVRIRNVRIFDPESLSLSKAVSVVLKGELITAIDSLSVQTSQSETEIDGAGGTLVAGLYDMHGHMGAEDALLNIAAGVTSVRDMGNSVDVLEGLVDKIDQGILAGPRITRYGFIEGKSEFSSNFGILVDSQEQALEAVRTYAEKGYPAVKLYNSMNGDWTPAIAKEAHRLNMKVSGHVPAFSNANAMIEAGYDELTHINQVMLGWVLEPDEDTRSLLRFTAMKRFSALDLNSKKVQKTINLMLANGVAVDPTMAIHEFGMTARNGETRIGTLDYVDNMPPAVQRNAKVALFKIENDKEDQDYRKAYEKIVATVKMMKERGIQLIPGTDLGGGFALHRELEIYQQFGFSPAEVVRLGSTDMANYLGQELLGSIEVGKLADFFLVPGDPTQDFKAIKRISLVSKGGVIYYPSEIYPQFGITPFTDLPKVKEAQ